MNVAHWLIPPKKLQSIDRKKACVVHQCWHCRIICSHCDGLCQLVLCWAVRQPSMLCGAAGEWFLLFFLCVSLKLETKCCTLCISEWFSSVLKTWVVFRYDELICICFLIVWQYFIVWNSLVYSYIACTSCKQFSVFLMLLYSLGLLCCVLLNHQACFTSFAKYSIQYCRYYLLGCNIFLQLLLQLDEVSKEKHLCSVWAVICRISSWFYLLQENMVDLVNQCHVSCISYAKNSLLTDSGCLKIWMVILSMS